MSLQLLKNALVEARKEIALTKYPNIVFPKHVTVNQQGNISTESILHYGGDISGSLDDGLVYDNTTTFDTVSVKFKEARTPIVPWIKTVMYNKYELEKFKQMGIALDTSKITALNKNAENTLQKVAYIGHGRDGRLRGLLNNSDVQLINSDTGDIVVSKPINKMTFKEAVSFFTGMFTLAIEKTKYIDMPNTFLIDASDLAYLALLQRDLGSDVTALKFLTENLSAAAGQPVKIDSAPSNFCQLITSGKKRAIIYNNSKDHVVFDIAVAPRILGAEQVGLVTYQTGMEMAFGGVTFIEPDSALYVEY